jgi:glycosyltransferase involved in cell wall biosynthesis
MAKFPLVVWMNQPSHYQTAFFRELATRPGVRLKVVYARALPAQRRQLGWTDCDSEVTGYVREVLGRWAPIRAVVLAWQRRREVHLLNGIWAEPTFLLASLVLRTFGAVYFYHSEAPNPAEERSGWINWIKLRLGASMIRQATGMFLIGTKAVDYFRRLGASEQNMFKFCYFLPTPTPLSIVRRVGTEFTILYLGQFVARKRVGDLIEAVAILRERQQPVILRIVGTGAMRDNYIEKIKKLGIEDRVKIEPPVAPSAVGQLLGEVDILGLVSEFDGWGLVVNEALQNGKPAVVSRGCGAAELVLGHRSHGEVVPVGSPVAIADALQLIARNRGDCGPSPAQVDKKIGCVAMTDYFIAAVNHALGGQPTSPALDW